MDSDPTSYSLLLVLQLLLINFNWNKFKTQQPSLLNSMNKSLRCKY